MKAKDTVRKAQATPRRCAVCRHRSAAAIEEALVVGRPLSEVAAQFAVSRASLRSHRRRHPSLALAESELCRYVKRGNKLLEELEAVIGHLHPGPIPGATQVAYLAEVVGHEPDGTPLRAVRRAPLNELLQRALGREHPEARCYHSTTDAETLVWRFERYNRGFNARADALKVLLAARGPAREPGLVM